MVQSCAACGCEVDDAESVRHGTHHYCSECARLILAPNDLQASSPRVRAVSKSAVAAASPTPGKGYNVVEEFNLTPDEVPVAEEEDDDPVFGSGGKREGPSSADDTIDMRPGQKTPRPSSRLQQAPSNAVGKAISGIGKAAPAMKPKPKPSPTGKPLKKGMAKTAGRPGRGSEKRPVRPAFPGKKQVQAPQDEEVLDAQPAETDDSEDFVVPMKKSKISGRSGQARGSQRGKASARTATSGRRSSRERAGDDDRDSGRKKVVAKRAEGLSTNAMIGIGVGVAFLLAMALFLGGGNDTEATKKKAVEVVEEDSDTTPSSEYARRAQDREAKGEKKAAFENYIKAANRAQSEGATTQAQRYAMQAKTIKETYHLNDR